jgi:hypothetical protein
VKIENDQIIEYFDSNGPGITDVYWVEVNLGENRYDKSKPSLFNRLLPFGDSGFPQRNPKPFIYDEGFLPLRSMGEVDLDIEKENKKHSLIVNFTLWVKRELRQNISRSEFDRLKERFNELNQPSTQITSHLDDERTIEFINFNDGLDSYFDMPSQDDLELDAPSPIDLYDYDLPEPERIRYRDSPYFYPSDSAYRKAKKK